MQVLVTGAAGHIGRAVVAELVLAGHDVVGLVRSSTAGDRVRALGADVVLGDVHDPDRLAGATATADAVVHLAYDNDAVRRGDLEAAATADLRTVNAIGEALRGSGRALIGVGMNSVGDPTMDRGLRANPRFRVSSALADLADRGVRSVVVGIPPVTHSREDRTGFIPTLVRIARARGASGYIDEGNNHWPAVHTLDLAALFRLAVERAPSRAQLLGAAEPALPFRAIAEAVGDLAGVPTVSVPQAVAAAHFSPFPFAGLDLTMPNRGTKDMVDWSPRHPGLLEDLHSGVYLVQD